MARLAVGTMARLAVRAFSLPHPSHPGGATGEDHRWHQERGWTPQETGQRKVIKHIGISDHEAVYFEYNSKVQIKNGVPRPIPLYSKANWDQLRADMKGLHSKIAEKPTSSAEELWSSFKEGLQSSIVENIPHKTTRRRAGQPWITTDIRKLINQRDRKYKQMKKKGTFELKTDLLHLRSKVQREIRRAELSYIGKLFETTVEETTKTPSTKRLWTYLKHKRTSSSGIPPLKENGRLVTDAKDKAELLNQQFFKAFSDGQAYTHEDFLQKCTMPSDESDFPQMENITVTTKGVEKLLENLNPYKAPGPDGISPRILKVAMWWETADEPPALLLS
ncbi:hypothetical protein ACOMHN_006037 [Nucella lapillus]